MIIAVVLIGASVIAWMTEPQKPENEQKADVIAEQDTQNVDADEKETEKQTTATEENRPEDTENVPGMRGGEPTSGQEFP